MRNTFSITMDMDWAPDEVISYSMDILKKYNTRATFFMTNKVGISTAPHVQGLHPNFTSGDISKHFLERLAEFPGSKGCRSHSLLYTERLRPLYEEHGITYDSNVMMYRQENIRPYKISPATIEIPLFWMDNFYLEMEGNYPSYDLSALQIDSPGIKLFNFHPVHVFLNTCSMDEYVKAKEFYHEPEKLAKCRNTSKKGTADFLLELLTYIQKSHSTVKTLEDITNDFSQNN